MELIRDTRWIWKPDVNLEEKDIPVFVLFRKTFLMRKIPVRGTLLISADSRYKLYINGKLAEVGPARGDRQVWFLDTVDISNLLKKGKNCIAVEVLHYPMDKMKGNFGVFRTETPGLYIEGTVEDEEGGILELNTDSTWKCKRRKERKIISEAPLFAPLQIYESMSGNAEYLGWKEVDFSDKDWENAVAYQNFVMSEATSPGNLIPRTTPFMYRKKREFKKTLKIWNHLEGKENWDQFLKGKKVIVIPENTECMVELSAGEEMTGYLYLMMTGGKDARLEIEQAESYYIDETTLEKGVRDDYENGVLSGYKDYYRVSGEGTDKIPECFEPFWFRTFRFIKIKIKTSEEALRLKSFYYEETGYPLEVKTKVETSDQKMKEIWDISERTLQRCMHETYEDCPFYEQLQYAMDTRSQILYTYQTAADDRLARKCMDDFKRSQRYDGLLNCCYPSVTPNVIPGFSIYYILMLYDHMMYFGDKDLIREHMTTVENILDFFEKNLDPKGYVGKVGGLNIRSRYWSFIDWTMQWNETTGVPDATLKGPITMESLLYLLGLEKAKELAEYVSRLETAERFSTRAKRVKNAGLNYCVGTDGMLQDGPGVEKYSQHCQVFAILTDLIPTEQGRKNLKKTLEDKENYAQCSVAMSYYLFRALEKTELYRYTADYWEIWIKMLKKHLTTCVEDDVSERSDCHAWGAVALFELPAVVLGVRPASPGYASVRIKPQTDNLDFVRGSVITPKGMIEAGWRKEADGSVKLEYQVPDTITYVK